MDITVTSSVREDTALTWATEQDNAERAARGESPRTVAEYFTARVRLELTALVRDYDAAHKQLVADRFVAADDATRASVLTTLKDVSVPDIGVG